MSSNSWLCAQQVICKCTCTSGGWPLLAVTGIVSRAASQVSGVTGMIGAVALKAVVVVVRPGNRM